MTRMLTAAEEHALGLVYSMTREPDYVFDRTRRDPNFNYKNTNAYKALVELRAGGGPNPSGGPTPTPTPAPNPYAALAQNVMFTAWDPEAGLRAPAHWTLAITADWDVSGNRAEHIARAKRVAVAWKGRLAVWANQEQIPLSQIDEMERIVDADYLILQGETEAEWHSALGENVIVGNPNAANGAQRLAATIMVNNGKLGVCFETYTNEGAPWPDQSSAAGVPVHSFCLGVGWGKNPNLQLADYKPHVPAGAWPAISVYLAEKMSDESWGLLP